jgi:arylsulfatase A-like enzyme
MQRAEKSRLRGRAPRASIEDLGEWDNTLFIYIVGDNGPAPVGRFRSAILRNMASSSIGLPSSKISSVTGRAIKQDVWVRDVRNGVVGEGAKRTGDRKW